MTAWERRWTGEDSEGVRWKVEIETDRFTADDPFVVSVFVEDTDSVFAACDMALATLSPTQARDLATSLLREADNCEANNRDGRAA